MQSDFDGFEIRLHPNNVYKTSVVILHIIPLMMEAEMISETLGFFHN
jgi:hypothetical protein